MEEWKDWLVTYSKNNETKETVIQYPCRPTFNQAALAIRDLVLGTEFALIDQYRGEPEPTVKLLRFYGVEIIGVDEAE